MAANKKSIDRWRTGSNEFVAINYQRFKHLFYSKREKKPIPIKGLEGIYSLKRLSEVVLRLFYKWTDRVIMI